MSSWTKEYLGYEFWGDFGNDFIEEKTLIELRDWLNEKIEQYGPQARIIESSAKGCRCLSCYEIQIVGD